MGIFTPIVSRQFALSHKICITAADKCVLSGYWMVMALNRRNWIFLPLIIAGLTPVLFPGIAQTAMLKDIRVGEYDSFTRIVFELDASTEPGKIQATDSGRVTVVFADTSAALIRRIPVERSRQVKNIQIWQQNKSLSAVIYFNFERYRHDSFQLSDPPRLVLDIKPVDAEDPQVLSVAPGEKASDADRDTAGSTEPEVEPEVSTSSPAAEPAPSVRQSLPQGHGALSSQEDSVQNAPAAVPSQSKSIDKPSAKEPPIKKTEGTRQPASSTAKRLQFYLVIALVLITIIILVLLLLMLLSKRRWVQDDPRLNTNEVLQKQDKHLASIDARIQEQLKRYEEA